LAADQDWDASSAQIVIWAATQQHVDRLLDGVPSPGAVEVRDQIGQSGSACAQRRAVDVEVQEV
jgi:hypothetical protein